MNAVLPLVAIVRGGKRPLHEQICAGLRAAILRGELAPGERVPSSRELAASLGVSRMPVLTAYSQLIAEGYFEARAGAGSFVARTLRPQPRAAANAPGSRTPRRLAQRVGRTPAYERLAWGWGAFGVHQPALEIFPYRLWAQLVQRHSRHPRAEALRRMNPMGSERCREAVCAYLRTSRGVQCSPEQVMMVSGSQQALDLCIRVLLDPAGAVWVEEPGYWLARHALLGAGCRLVPVAVDAEGLDVARGMRQARGARAAYVTPSHQYPLGTTMSAARRMQLLEWAEAAGAWIIEDDYDGEYRAQPVASLQGLDPHARVIYIGTLSKVMFPNLRLGYMILPRDLVEAFTAVRYAMDIAPPYLAQEALADFMLTGHFARHIQRTRRLYRERRTALAASLAEAMPGWRVHGAASGMHLALASPRWCDDRAIAAAAAKHGLWLWPLSPAYVGRAGMTGFILGYGSTAAAAMPAAVHRLAREIAAAPGRRP